MAYKFKKIFIKTPTKAYLYLYKQMGVSLGKAQSLLDKGYLKKDGIVCKKNDIIFGECEFLVYENKPRGIDIIYENEDFVVVDKESFVLTHPNGRNCEYSLCDDLWDRYGKECSVAHRLDFETSGVLCAGKNAQASKKLKEIFAKGEVKKEYLAVVRGEYEDMLKTFGKSFYVNEPLMLTNNENDFKNKMIVNENGKQSLTFFELLSPFDDGLTLVLAKPITGRQHQIRAHLFHVKHQILGDIIYGFSKTQTQNYLDKIMSEEQRFELLGAKRLCLHASSIEFTYNDKVYKIKSKKDIISEFRQAICK